MDHARSEVSVAWRDRTSGVDKIVVTSVDATTIWSCESVFTLQAGSFGPPRLYATASASPLADEGQLRLVWTGAPLGPTPTDLQGASWQSCP